MENKKAFSLLLMPLQLMEITLNCFRIHICIMTTLYTLGLTQPSKGRFGYNEVPVLYVPAAASNCTKSMLRQRLRSSRYCSVGTVPYLRDAETHYYT